MHIDRLVERLIVSKFSGDMSAVRTAASAGNKEAQFATLLKGGIEENRNTITEWEQNGISVHDNLSYLQYSGLCFLEEYLDLINDNCDDEAKLKAAKDKAIAPLFVSAESGLMGSQYAVGMLMLVFGFGSNVKTDFLDGARWVRMAAAQGLMEAEYEIGEMLRHGLLPDMACREKRALRYIKSASEQGHPEASAYMQELKSCVMCGEDYAPLKCKRCRKMRYCDSDCSTKHWREGGGVGEVSREGAEAKHKHACERA
jgi:TPR repeat protein